MKKCLFVVFMMFHAIFSFGQGTKWIDLNYANDSVVGHKLDIYLPDVVGQSRYKVVVIIYGSAWFANNMKQMAFQIMGKPLLKGGLVQLI
ncbi:MAG: hypothetical protein LKI39_05085 [Bacteroides sp.]|jgi:hypothetical protein|nr:hypothetical protein [Bacteroides sp.]MCI1681911.1 hypothetical protein [Bacteroides sp.]